MWVWDMLDKFCKVVSLYDILFCHKYRIKRHYMYSLYCLCNLFCLSDKKPAPIIKVAGKIVEKSQPSISKTVRQDIDDADDEESYYKWLEVITYFVLFILKRVSAKASGKLIVALNFCFHS